MKKSIFKRSTAVILVLVLLAVSLAALFVPVLELGKERSLDISDESKKYLSSLDETVEIYVVDNGFYDYKFEEFMKAYAKTSDKLSVKFMNAADATDILALCGESVSNVTSYTVVVKSDKRAKLIDYYSLFYYNTNFGQMSYSQYTQYYQLFASSESYLSSLDKLVYESKYYFYGDALLTGIVEYVTLDIIPKAYILSSHGTDSVKDGNFAKLLVAMGYEFGELSLSDSAAIPEDAGVIVINEPQNDLTSTESEAMLDYLKGGGRLLLVTGENAKDMPNLLSVADYYGVTLKEGRVAEVVEEKESFTVTPILNTDHDIIASMGSYTPKMINANAIGVKSEGLRKAMLVTELLVTSADAYIEGAADSKQSFTLGVAVEEETAKGNTRLVWFTGAESFNGEIETADSLALLLYSTAWLNKSYTSEIGNIPAVLYGEGVMKVPENAVTFGIILAVVTTAAIITVGVLVTNKRKKA